MTPDSNITFELIASKENVNSNILIVFHGLGDSIDNFKTFAKAMQLPQTALLMVQGQFEVPMFPHAYSYFPTFNTNTGEELLFTNPYVQQGLLQSRRNILNYIRKKILYNENENDQQAVGLDSSDLGKRRWPAERIFLFGFGQGGQIALDILCSRESNIKLGGVISLSGFLDESYRKSGLRPSSELPPVLITSGKMETTSLNLKYTKEYLGSKGNFVQFEGGQGDKDDPQPTMPTCAKDMRMIFEFFGKHLWLRNLAMEKMADVVIKVEKV